MRIVLLEKGRVGTFVGHRGRSSSGLIPDGWLAILVVGLRSWSRTVRQGELLVMSSRDISLSIGCQSLSFCVALFCGRGVFVPGEKLFKF